MEGVVSASPHHKLAIGLQELLLAEVVQGPVLVGTQGEIPSPPRTSTGGCNGEVEEVVEGLGGLPLALLELGPWGCVSRYLAFLLPFWSGTPLRHSLPLMGAPSLHPSLVLSTSVPRVSLPRAL